MTSHDCKRLCVLFGPSIFNLSTKKAHEMSKNDLMGLLANNPKVIEATNSMIASTEGKCPPELNTYPKDPPLGDVKYVIETWRKQAPTTQESVREFINVIMDTSQFKALNLSGKRIEHSWRLKFGIISKKGPSTQPIPGQAGQHYVGQYVPAQSWIRHETEKQGNVKIVSNLSEETGKGDLVNPVHPDTYCDNQAVPTITSLHEAMTDLSTSACFPPSATKTQEAPRLGEADTKIMKKHPTQLASHQEMGLSSGSLKRKGVSVPAYSKKETQLSIYDKKLPETAPLKKGPAISLSDSAARVLNPLDHESELVIGDDDSDFKHEEKSATAGIRSGATAAPPRLITRRSSDFSGLASFGHSATAGALVPHGMIEEYKTRVAVDRARRPRKVGGRKHGSFIPTITTRSLRSADLVTSPTFDTKTGPDKKSRTVGLPPPPPLPTAAGDDDDSGGGSLKRKGKKDEPTSALEVSSKVSSQEIRIRNILKILNDSGVVDVSSANEALGYADKASDVIPPEVQTAIKVYLGKLAESTKHTGVKDIPSFLKALSNEVMAVLNIKTDNKLPDVAVTSGTQSTSTSSSSEHTMDDYNSLSQVGQTSTTTNQQIGAGGNSTFGGGPGVQGVPNAQAPSSTPAEPETQPPQPGSTDQRDLTPEQIVEKHNNDRQGSQHRPRQDSKQDQLNPPERHPGEYNPSGEYANRQGNTGNFPQDPRYHATKKKSMKPDIPKDYEGDVGDPHRLTTRKKQTLQGKPLTDEEYDKNARSIYDHLSLRDMAGHEDKNGVLHLKAGDYKWFGGLFNIYVPVGMYSGVEAENDNLEALTEAEKKEGQENFVRDFIKHHKNLAEDYDIVHPDDPNPYIIRPEYLKKNKGEPETDVKRTPVDLDTKHKPPSNRTEEGERRVNNRKRNENKNREAKYGKIDPEADNKKAISDKVSKRDERGQGKSIKNLDENGNQTNLTGSLAGAADNDPRANLIQVETNQNMLRPSFIEGGANKVLEINNDPSLELIDRLEWQAFNNYTWEANEESDNILRGMNLVDDWRRFKGMNDEEELLPQMALDAIGESYNTKMEAFSIPESMNADTHEEMWNTVPPPYNIEGPTSVENVFHDVYIPDWYSLPADNPWKKMSQINGTQLPDSQLKNAARVMGNDWTSGKWENDYLGWTLA